MSSGIEKLRDKLKNEYEAWQKSGKFVGYIQMSDSRIEKKYILESPQTLPDIDYNNKNYILEMALFQEDSGRSILLRQHNDGWLILDKNLKEIKKNDNYIVKEESYFTVTPNTPKMKIAQIWKPENSEFCNEWDVLEPKCLMFAGFEVDNG